MLKKVALAAALCAALYSNAASALTQTATIGVSATISGTCTISATALAFGSLVTTSSNTDVNSTVTVNCSNTLPYTVGIDDGAFAGAVGTHPRQMNSGGNRLGYQVYTDVAGGTIFDNNVGAGAGINIISGTGSGSAANITVFGRLPTQATPAFGAYTDTLTVTVSY